MVKTEDEIPPDVGINEVSGGTDEMTDVDEAWSDLMTYRPVWVRSRPIFRFPCGDAPLFRRGPSDRSTHPLGRNGRDESGLGQRT